MELLSGSLAAAPGWVSIRTGALGLLQARSATMARPPISAGRRPQTLLVALALAHGDPAPAGPPLDEAWRGERLPDRNAVEIDHSRLRRVLGAGLDPSMRRGGIPAPEIPDAAVDAARFYELVADWAGGPPDERCGSCGQPAARGDRPVAWSGVAGVRR